MIGEIYIDFDSGKISGNFGPGCHKEELITAMKLIANKLNDNPKEFLHYIEYDECKIFGN